MSVISSTNSSNRTAPAPSPATLTFLAAASLSDSVNLAGASVVRLLLGATWTTANLTVQTSPDGATWSDLYDEFGNVYTVIAAASRSIFIAPGPLLALAYIRLRSGTPSTPVAQVSQTTVVVQSAPL